MRWGGYRSISRHGIIDRGVRIVRSLCWKSFDLAFHSSFLFLGLGKYTTTTSFFDGFYAGCSLLLDGFTRDVFFSLFLFLLYYLFLYTPNLDHELFCKSRQNNTPYQIMIPISLYYYNSPHESGHRFLEPNRRDITYIIVVILLPTSHILGRYNNKLEYKACPRLWEGTTGYHKRGQARRNQNR
jgi:hypothetical protein